ncbi:MAG: twin-arginine translocase subunit TatB [Rhodocyclaceae bacterium]|nr:twin-arginine translocase subunit TatB [Rhodocyclaceae bacterium]
MFDVGFSELLVIGVVALLVLGPERLPRLARDVGRWMGRARRYVNRVREEIDREVELSELRRLRDEIEAKAREVQDEVDTAAAAVHATLDDVAQPRIEAHAAARPAAPPVAAAADAAAAVAPPRRRRKPAAADPAAPAAESPAAVPRKRASRARKVSSA